MNAFFLALNLSVRAIQPIALADSASSVTFEVTGLGGAAVHYQLRLADRPDMPVLEEGEIVLEDGSALIVYEPAFPCVVHCRVSAAGQSADAAAAFKPTKISASEPPPADFDAFWDGQKALLAQVPLDVELGLLAQHAYFSTYTIRFSLTEGRKCYGYLCVPAGPGPFPAIIEFPAYGFSPNIVQPPASMAERGGAIALSLNIHDNPPDQPGPADYLTAGATAAETHYYKYAVLSAVRAIDYLHTRPDFNGQVGAMGVSQGGGLALLAAGIDGRVSALAVFAAALCDHAGQKHGKPSGFPYYYALGGDALLGPARYFDAAHAAAKFQGAAYTALGFEDDVCPPATSLAAYNALRGEQVRLHLPQLKHNPTPEEYANPGHPNGVYAFFRAHFPAMQSPPWPWPDKSLGYTWELPPLAGAQAGAEALLQASVRLNSQLAPAYWPLLWEKTEGDGGVFFEDAEAAHTQAVFAESGDYRLRISAFDADYHAANPDRYYTTSAESAVQVGQMAAPWSFVISSDSNTVVADTFYLDLRAERPFSGLEKEAFDCARCEVLSILKINELESRLECRAMSKGLLSVQLPANAASDANGQGNAASNLLELKHVPHLKTWDGN